MVTVSWERLHKRMGGLGMNIERVNRWLTLGANLGVLVGIVFLALEIRQNSEIARLQFTEDQHALWQEGEIAVFGDSIATLWERSITEPESLSLAELRMLDAYLAFQLTRVSRISELEQAGMLEPGTAQTEAQGILPFFFDTTFAKAWWEIEGKTWEPEVVEVVDPVVTGVSVNESANKLLNIQRETIRRMGESQ
jgi:hypothetical protein